eukprot:CAMPEP_0119120528 /NCGR_PEP_ID=MMETSP1310-20130426/1525_1 /TAXON_ID=464262 /ORGANISM="Genus nov. species nov., Strain RCC2339" /LENGTH=259 /DNA_ID=CAMNT_0007110009 /DNA_START=11 /DNA_END=790 /DNA_ORIENTATION=-
MYQPRSATGLMVAGEMCWPPFGPAVLPLWDRWIRSYATMPDWVDVDPVWLPLGPDGARMFCFTTICNQDADLCWDYLAPYLAAEPTLNDIKEQPFLDWQRANVNVTSAQHDSLYLTSGILKAEAVTLSLIAELMAALAAAPSERNLVLFHVGGGKIAEVSPTATAFPHRDVELVVQAKAIWSDPSEEEANTAWVTHVRDTILMPHLSGSYVNYIDPNFPDPMDSYYKENYPRLVHVQQTYDPDHVFDFPLAVGRTETTN